MIVFSFFKRVIFDAWRLYEADGRQDDACPGMEETQLLLSL